MIASVLDPSGRRSPSGPSARRHHREQPFASGTQLLDEVAGGIVGGEQEVGRPEVEPPTVDERRRRPLAFAVERLDTIDLPGRVRADRRDDRRHRRVRITIGRGERNEPVADLVVGAALGRVGGGERDLAGGDRARLVEAQHVDAGEHFDRRELFGERVAASERHDACHERQAGEQHQAVGHHRNGSGHGAEQCVLPVVLGAEEIDEQEDRCDRNDHGEPPQDAVDALTKLRLRRGELFRLGGQRARIAVGAHRGRPNPPVAGHHETA